MEQEGQDQQDEYDMKLHERRRTQVAWGDMTWYDKKVCKNDMAWKVQIKVHSESNKVVKNKQLRWKKNHEARNK